MIEMRVFTVLGTLLILFASCQQEEKIVFIEFSDSEGIKPQDHVLLQGASVGTVLDVDITKDNKVLASVRLSDSLNFPEDTGFEIQRQDLFTRMIYVTLGKSETFLKNGDTIQGIRRIDVLDQIECTNGSPAFFDEIKEMLRN